MATRFTALRASLLASSFNFTAWSYRSANRCKNMNPPMARVKMALVTMTSGSVMARCPARRFRRKPVNFIGRVRDR